METNRITPIAGLPIAVLTAAAMGLSIYLGISEPERLAGCTGESGGDCAGVLGSKWASVWGLPVAFGGAVVYGLAFVSTVAALVSGLRVAWFVLCASLTAAAASAIWFTGLQIVEIEGFCRYCLATHAFGSAACLLFVADLLRQSRTGLRSAFVGGPAVGLLAVGLLIAGQVYDRYEIRVAIVDRWEVDADAEARAEGFESQLGVGALDTATPAPTSIESESGEGRRIELVDGKLAMVLGEYPVLGDINAPLVMGVLSDYTCPGCKILHADLEAALARYPGQFAVVVFPVSLDAKCNPHLEETSHQHRNACLLSKMSLALWNTNRTAFHEYDRTAFAEQRTLERDDIVTIGDRLVGPDTLDAAMRNPLYDKMLYFSINLFHSPLLEKRQLPTLLFPDGVVQGNRETREELFRLLEERLGVSVPTG